MALIDREAETCPFAVGASLYSGTAFSSGGLEEVDSLPLHSGAACHSDDLPARVRRWVRPLYNVGSAHALVLPFLRA